MPTLDDIKKELRGYLAEDDFDNAFELFRRITDDESRLESDIILQQGQFNSIMRSARNGTAAPDQTERGLNRIRAALIEMVDKMKESDLDPAMGVGNNSASALSALEIQGLQKQLELSIQRINALREALAIQFDPNVKFALEKQIEGLEKEIESIRARIV